MRQHISKKKEDEKISNKQENSQNKNMTPNPPRQTPPAQALVTAATTALDDKKAKDLTHINLDGKSSMADDMIIATGTSRPHVLALAGNVRDALKKAGAPMVSTEGEEDGQWVLVDGGDIVVHIFQPEARDHYRLERLWCRSFDVDDDNELGEELNSA